MNKTCIVGLQWGDEGKGKITDTIAPEYDAVIRYQGGANAGHTVKVGNETFKLNLIPSGIIHPGKLCFIGNGVAVDFAKVVEEVATLESKGVEVRSRLFISELAAVVLPIHKLMDYAVEDLRGEERIGTTHRGIGPCYADKAYRIGLRVGDFFNKNCVRQRVAMSRDQKVNFLESHGAIVPSVDSMVDELYENFNKISSMVSRASKFAEILERQDSMLFEGAQGTLLDIDFGSYPYVTSSHTVSGAIFTGTGIPIQDVNVLGVVKAYCTRVGTGPFPTEDTTELGTRLREIGQEYGVVTGRPRRCGWLDIPALKHAVAINKVNEIALTKIDVLSGFESIPVCVEYADETGPISRYPLTAQSVYDCYPSYDMMEGWENDLSNVKTFADLPNAAKRYIEKISDHAGVIISMVSVGPKRDQILMTNG